MMDVLTDPQSWKDLAWLTFAGTFGFIAGVIALSLWLVVVGFVTVPAWYWAVPAPGADVAWMSVDTFGEAFLALDIGLILAPLAYLASRWMAEGQLRLSRVLLAPTREAALSARVSELTATRAGAVDAAAAELQRIERDLHDGAQARLVALALDLGMAEERFARDPEGARQLIGDAREEAKRALGGAARPRPRHPPQPAHRARPRSRADRARRPQPGAGDGRDRRARPRAAAGRARRSGSSSPRRSPTRASTPAPPA